jgi:hypothetical protein
MTSSRSRPLRVGVAAAPPLLSDTIVRLVESSGVGDVLVVDGAADELDVLLTTDAGPSVPARLRIHLGSREGRGAVGTVEADPGQPLVEIDGLPGVLDFIRRWGDDRSP